ncbi:MAG: 50S ribosomal protein L11, partial [Chloroflexi bacterium]|nr:50S ribosomal protein L11 [Chloroflexota bacterium]
NERTARSVGQIVPVAITVFADRSFAFELKSPPASDLLRRAAGIEKGADATGVRMVGSVTRSQVREIAETKVKDLNASDVDAAMHIIEGTARSMGVTIVG